jgi:hypothetical protein
MRSLEGQVALVIGGGAPLGRAIALALAARGVRIVVAGAQERALGETVGEIAHAGGKARHVAGNVRDAAYLEAAVARANEVFGGLDIVVDAEPGSPVGPLLARLRSPGRIVTLGSDARMVRELASAGAAQAITCNAALLEIPAGADVESVIEDRAMALAEVVVVLCESAADRITGQTLTLGAR